MAVRVRCFANCERESVSYDIFSHIFLSNFQVPEMVNLDPKYFVDTFRMTPKLFEELLSKVGPMIQKESFHVRESIPAAERLYATLA